MRESKEQFRRFLLQKGLKSTRQREIVLDAFLRSATHLSTEELYLKIRRKHPNIGYATVHRTLKLFTECGLAEERNFGDGQIRYEWTGDKSHHDHLVCTSCGAISEFEDSRIEQLQQDIAARYGFVMTSHRHDLYGICAKCRTET